MEMREGKKMDAKKIRIAAEQERAYMVALRRELHRHPEVSGEERWTSARIAGVMWMRSWRFGRRSRMWRRLPYPRDLPTG